MAEGERRDDSASGRVQKKVEHVLFKPKITKTKPICRLMKDKLRKLMQKNHVKSRRNDLLQTAVC